VTNDVNLLNKALVNGVIACDGKSALKTINNNDLGNSVSNPNSTVVHNCNNTKFISSEQTAHLIICLRDTFAHVSVFCLNRSSLNIAT